MSNLLIINGGSSSIKFALYAIGDPLTSLLAGELERIGMPDAKLSYSDPVTHQKKELAATADDPDTAANFLIDWLEKQEGFDAVRAIGHRIVHGMKHTAPVVITPELLDELKKFSAYDPEHLPGEIELIEIFRQRCPGLDQVACFDTSFHTAMPTLARLLPLPRRYEAMGVQRYGFHGLSYAWLLQELTRKAGKKTADGRLILAHLGNGASLAAVKEGRPMDTSMGFTPASGLTMSTRTGDLDPGVASYLMQADKLSPEQFNHLINHESGLLGVSGTSSDMRELLKHQDTDSQAAQAIELFCYQVKKWIGSFAAVLGGLDTLVFSGGIGENSPEVRSRICQGLQFLGVQLDETKNLTNEAIISTDDSRSSVHVMKTNEELMIAGYVCQVLNFTVKK